MDRKQKFERSNAFVDGELDREERAAVLAESARDPRTARELANLNRLKSAVEDSVDVPDIELPSVPRRRRPFRRVGWAIAASVVLLVMGGIAWKMLPVTPGHDIPVAWAVKSHNSWIDIGAEPNAKDLLLPANTKLNAYVPDLTAAKLYIAYVSTGKNPDGQPSLLVGYRGTRGCRVTLLIDLAPQKFGKQAVYFEVGQLSATVWRAGALRHFILAEGMALPRFKAIAEAVRRTSLKRLPVDDETRMVLAQSRASSPPCAA